MSQSNEAEPNAAAPFDAPRNGRPAVATTPGWAGPSGDGRQDEAVDGTRNGRGPTVHESWRIRQLLLAAANAERERIERDIHDGAQQRFTALRLRLALAAERHEASGEGEISSELRGFANEVDDAIDVLRKIADGVYPSRLSADGLGRALASAGRHVGLPVTVTCRVGRYSPEVESAVYFSCIEAMQNAAKHAGRSEVTVRLWETQDALHFSVSDTGVGFDLATTPAGTGHRNMRARLLAVDGTLRIDSASQRGTRVQGTVPYP